MSLVIRRAASDAVLVAAGLLATRGSAFIVSLMVARLGGVDVFGAFTLFISLYVLASELPTALDTTYMRFANAPKFRDQRRAVTGILLVTKLAYALAIMLCGMAGSGFLAERVFDKPAMAPVIQYALVSGAFLSVYYALLAYFQSRRRFGVQAILRPLPAIVIILLLASFFVSGNRLEIDILWSGYLVTAGVFSIVAFAFLASRGSWCPRSVGLWGEYLRHAAVLGGASAINLILVQVDVFFVSALLSIEQVGLYGVAVRIYALMAILVTVLSTVLMPEAPRALENSTARRRYFLTASFMFILGLLFCSAAAAFMRPLIALVFGDAYLSVAAVAIWMLVKVVGMLAAVPFQVMLACGDSPQHFLFVVIMRLVLLMAALDYFVPVHGLMGAAVSSAVVVWVSALMMAGLVWRHQIKRHV